MITVLLVKAAFVSLWRAPNLQAVSARSFKTLDGQATRTAGSWTVRPCVLFFQMLVDVFPFGIGKRMDETLRSRKRMDKPEEECTTEQIQNLKDRLHTSELLRKSTMS